MCKERVVPIFIHHESNEKPSKGLGKNQKYLECCVRQAERNNERVILFGDESNKNWANEWYPVNKYLSERWTKFEKVFKNMSDYPLEWAKGIFKRFFIFEDFCLKNGISELVIMDSDVLLYQNLSCNKRLAQCEVAMIWDKNQDIALMGTEGKNMALSAQVGVGYFTIEALTSFIDFCIDTYSGEGVYSILEKKWMLHQKYAFHGGVCEMTLLYLWKERCGYKVINLAENVDGEMFNSNIVGKNNYIADAFAISKAMGTKRVFFKDNKPYFLSIVDNKKVRVEYLHFGGDSKYFIYDYYRYSRLKLWTICSYCLIKFYREKLKKYIKA